MGELNNFPITTKKYVQPDLNPQSKFRKLRQGYYTTFVKFNLVSVIFEAPSNIY
jgi:hypothetical protein